MFSCWRSLCGQTGSAPLIAVMPVPSAGPVINDLRDRHPYRVLPLALGTCLGDVNGWTWAAPSTWRVPSSFRLASFWIRRSGRWGIAIAVFIDPDIVAQAIVVGINANQSIGAGPFITRDAAGVCISTADSWECWTLSAMRGTSPRWLGAEGMRQMSPTGTVYSPAQRVCDRLLLESRPREGDGSTMTSSQIVSDELNRFFQSNVASALTEFLNPNPPKEGVGSAS